MTATERQEVLEEWQQAMDKWLLERPLAVQQAAKEFPPGTSFNLHGKSFYLVGWRDDGSLLISEVNPAVDYERAVATRQPVCKCCAHKLKI